MNALKEEKDALVSDINEILKRHDIQVAISNSDIGMSEKSVYDFLPPVIPIDAQASASMFEDGAAETEGTQDAELSANMFEDRLAEEEIAQGVKQDAKLSDAITRSLWRSITSASVYHYTPKDKAEKILKTKKFRLYNIAKGYNVDGIRDFCEAHGLKGDLEQDENGDPRYRKSIIQNSFYASFTDIELTAPPEEYFLKHYGDVRLKFEITALNPHFRKIYYEATKGKPIPVLSDLTKCIREKYNSRVFILQGISSLCFFYLSSKCNIENEYRLLCRIQKDCDLQPKYDCECGYNYIELPLDKMSECGYKLKIVEVQAIKETAHA